MIRSTPISFEFPDPVSAELAISMLRELGFETQRADDQDNRILFLHDVRNNLYTGIEIAQMHGGNLVEREIPVPAHIVNEDWTEAYQTGNALEMAQPAEDDRGR